MEPSDFWGPFDTLRMNLYDNNRKMYFKGNGPYLSRISFIDKKSFENCSCGYERLLMEMKNVIIVRFYFTSDELDSTWDMIIKCPKCGKIWRDIE